MDIGLPEHRRERSRSTELRDEDDSLSKHRGKSSRREDKEYRSKDREQSKTTHGSSNSLPEEVDELENVEIGEQKKRNDAYKAAKKKKKTMRKREKLDIDAMEAEAESAGLGGGDLGSPSDGRTDRSALARAEEASKALLAPKRKTVEDEDDTLVMGDDDDDLRKSVDRARKLGLKPKSEAATSYPMTINLLTPSASESAVDNKTSSADTSENKVVFTEMELWSRQLDEQVQKCDGVPNDSEEKKMKVEDGGWSEETAPENTIHETCVGKGLAGTLQLLNRRGSLKGWRIESGGRNTDKKKSKLLGIQEDRRDEYGRVVTPREAFRLLSHKFHGKGPGKRKQEKRMRQYQGELKMKQMQNSDTQNSHSVERMKEVQAQLKTPHLVLTPMLGNQKVEYFLGKRRHDSGGSCSSVDKKAKT